MMLLRVARLFLVQNTKTGKIYRITTNYTKYPQSTTKDRKSVYKIIQPLSARPSKIYPNLDFWFENKPSANLMLLLFDT
jgi:cytidylate kinase